MLKNFLLATSLGFISGFELNIGLNVNIQFSEPLKFNYESLNATIPEEKDPTDLTMEEALILIEKRREYDKSKKSKVKRNNKSKKRD